MKTIKPYKVAFENAIEQLLESVYTIIPKEIEIENHFEYVNEEFSNELREHRMEKDSSVIETVTEKLGLNENEEGFAAGLELVLMVNELQITKATLRFTDYFKNTIKDGSRGDYTTKIMQHFKEKTEYESVSTSDFPILLDFISRCLLNTVFASKTDEKLSLYFGIQTEIHYELLKKVVDTFIEFCMISKGYEFANFVSETLNLDARIVEMDYYLKEIVRKAEFKNNYKPIVWEATSYHLQNNIEYLKTKHSLTNNSLPPPKDKTVEEKKGKNPSSNQESFLKAFVKNLKEGHKKTYAIEAACISSKYTVRNGKIIDKQVRLGLLKYEPLSEILYPEKNKVMKGN